MIVNEQHGRVHLLSRPHQNLSPESASWDEQAKHPNQNWSMNGVFVPNVIHLCILFKNSHLMSRFPSESHWPETPREYSLQFMWPNPVKCGRFHRCVSTKHVCLLDAAVNIEPSFPRIKNLFGQSANLLMSFKPLESWNKPVYIFLFSSFFYVDVVEPPHFTNSLCELAPRYYPQWKQHHCEFSPPHRPGRMLRSVAFDNSWNQKFPC